MANLFEDAVRSLEERKASFNRSRRPQKPAQVRFRWIRLEGELDLIIRSPLEWWYTHWDLGRGRTRRCAGEGCILCAEGVSVQIRYVLAVEDPAGIVWLLELRERHKELLEALNDAPKGQIGAILRGRKRGMAKNSPIDFELVDRVETVPIELSRIVATLGLPEQRSARF